MFCIHSQCELESMHTPITISPSYGAPVLALCMMPVHDRSNSNKYEDLHHTVLSVHADSTAGCNSGEGPMWYIDQESLLHSLEVVYKRLFPALCAPFTSFTFLQLRSNVLLTPTIVDFQQFTKGEEPSVFAFLLQHHCRHIVYALKWALDKMIQSFNHSSAHYKYSVNDRELKWLVVALISSYHKICQWCIRRVVLQIPA